MNGPAPDRSRNRLSKPVAERSVTLTSSNWNVWSRGLFYGTWSYQCQISTTIGVVPRKDLLVGDSCGIKYLWQRSR
ncbi:hypothetical protein ACR1PO_03285 [Chryseobacterium sp. RRHN12]|uniref:hypothetical protein n=1 Tax=Chryseobacterium sp. RRHN12 TaxID=3437884 RepID=UPI003D9B167A